MSKATGLCRRLGVRPEYLIRVIRPPSYYFTQLLQAPFPIHRIDDATTLVDFQHVFESDQEDLARAFTAYCGQIKHNGMLWISWPKRSSGRITSIDRSVIRAQAAIHGMQDVKVCSLDPTWSAIKLVHRS